MSDKIKALHKDCYFVTLDRERKDKLIRKTSEEMKLEKKEKKLEAIVAKLKVKVSYSVHCQRYDLMI